MAYSIFIIRGVQRASGVSVYGGMADTETYITDWVSPGNIRTIGRIAVFSDSVGFRGPPRASGVSVNAGSATETRSTNAVCSGNIRILCLRMLFLAAASYRGLPGCPHMPAPPFKRIGTRGSPA